MSFRVCVNARARMYIHYVRSTDHEHADTNKQNLAMKKMITRVANDSILRLINKSNIHVVIGHRAFFPQSLEWCNLFIIYPFIIVLLGYVGRVTVRYGNG